MTLLEFAEENKVRLQIADTEYPEGGRSKVVVRVFDGVILTKCGPVIAEGAGKDKVDALRSLERKLSNKVLVVERWSKDERMFNIGGLGDNKTKPVYLPVVVKKCIDGYERPRAFKKVA